jgi:hypothetical protein
MLLEKTPVPLPSVVFVISSIEGFGLVLQQTPLADMEAPPSPDIIPPEEAVVCVIDDDAIVVSAGKVTKAVVV